MEDLKKLFIKACNSIAKKHSVRIEKKTEDFGEGVSQVRYYVNGHSFAGCDGNWIIAWSGSEDLPISFWTKMESGAEKDIEAALMSWLQPTI